MACNPISLAYSTSLSSVCSASSFTTYYIDTTDIGVGSTIYTGNPCLPSPGGNAAPDGFYTTGGTPSIWFQVYADIGGDGYVLYSGSCEYQAESCCTGTNFLIKQTDELYNSWGTLNEGTIYNINTVGYTGCCTIVEYSGVGVSYDAISVDDTYLDCLECLVTNQECIYSFSDCCDSSQQFNVLINAGSFNVGEIHYLETNVFSGCATVITYNSLLSNIYVLSSSTGPYPSTYDCFNTESVSCPCPSTYCLDTGGVVIYDGDYTSGGTYNGYNFYTGGTLSTGYIYFDTVKWCLSNTLGGSCVLFGKTPCAQACPDLCDELYSGTCATISPTPTNPCDVVDFDAMFNCNVPTPTPSPTNTSTQTPTPTPTPTVTPTSICNFTSISLSATSLPTITPTITPTPTPTLDRNLCFAGNVTFNLLDANFECSLTKMLVDCKTQQIYYINHALVYNGFTLETGYTFNAVINGAATCVTYSADTTNSSTAILSSIINVYGNYCATCPTPTPTLCRPVGVPSFITYETATNQNPPFDGHFFAGSLSDACYAVSYYSPNDGYTETGPASWSFGNVGDFVFSNSAGCSLALDGYYVNDFTTGKIVYVLNGVIDSIVYCPTPTPTLTPTLTPTATPVPPSFISVWRTTSDNQTITLPLVSSGNYNFTVNWGDGNVDTVIAWNQSTKYHTYTVQGTYTVTISGTIDGWSFNNTGSKDKIISVNKWGPLKLGNNGANFYGCINLRLNSVVDILDLTGVYNLNRAFFKCGALTTVNNMNSWNTTSVINMALMFSECTNFNQNISSWDMSNVSNTSSMFSLATSFNQPIGNWDVSSVTDMSYMFQAATSFNQPIGGWDVSSVQNMMSMFQGATSFNTYLGNWSVSNVTNMNFMFGGAILYNSSLSNWERAGSSTSGVTQMSGMFINATNFNQPIGTWNVSNLQDASLMFASTGNFNQDLSNWERANSSLSALTNATGMFQSAVTFNNGGSSLINNWDTSGVNNMSYMFAYASSFNQPIQNWNVQSVSDMMYMFLLCSSFNQPLNGWDVSFVSNMRGMFSYATAFNQPLNNWDITNVTNFTDFMLGKTYLNYSSTNLDTIYNDWANLSVQPNLNINFSLIKHTSAGTTGKNILLGAPNNWIITDGGI